MSSAGCADHRPGQQAPQQGVQRADLPPQVAPLPGVIPYVQPQPDVKHQPRRTWRPGCGGAKAWRRFPRLHTARRCRRPRPSGTAARRPPQTAAGSPPRREGAGTGSRPPHRSCRTALLGISPSPPRIRSTSPTPTPPPRTAPRRTASGPGGPSSYTASSPPPYPYHLDGGLCALYPTRAVQAMAQAATAHKLYSWASFSA